MLELPNAYWIRSPKMPNYAICLDPDSPVFGWKMYENEAYQQWATSAKLTPEEVDKALQTTDLVFYWPLLLSLKEKLQEIR